MSKSEREEDERWLAWRRRLRHSHHPHHPHHPHHRSSSPPSSPSSSPSSSSSSPHNHHPHHPLSFFTLFIISLLSTTFILSPPVCEANSRAVHSHSHNSQQGGGGGSAVNSPPRFKAGPSTEDGSPGAGGDFDLQSEIVVRVKEGASSLNREIYHLYGEDADGDTLHFGVLGTLGRDLLRIEAVGATEARVTLKKELDREIQDSYTLVLTLTDGKLGKGNYITKSLLLIVEDINDNAPIFRPFRTAVSVREDAKPGTLLETVEAFDSDEGRFGQVLYQLEDDSGSQDSGVNFLPTSQLFSIQTVEGKGVIRLAGTLDYERKSLYQIRVLAVDRAMEGQRKTSTAAIVVQVEDVDDQPPIFTSVPSVTRIAEDTPVGGAVLQITAIDGDRGVNRPISYAITKGGEGGLFAIDRQTGLVTVAGRLDREATDSSRTSGSPSSSAVTSSSTSSSSSSGSSYILEIEATEVGGSQHPAPKASTEVTIILTDVNDELPRFRASSYTAEIVENSPADMPVTFTGRMSKSGDGSGSGSSGTSGVSGGGQLYSPQVYDLDQGNNGTFTLHLELDDDEGEILSSELKGLLADAFYVTPLQSTNEATLSVRVRNPQALDYEKLKKVRLRLIAKEKTPSAGGNGQLRFSTAELLVSLKDANDNTPVFREDIYYGSVAENASPGTVVARVGATDVDEGLYGSEGIRYTALRGDIAPALTLNPITGVISVKTGATLNSSGAYFDRERHLQHFLIVEARDAAGFGNRNTVQLIVNITDVNDQAPRFQAPPGGYQVRLAENSVTFEGSNGGGGGFFVSAVDDDEPGSANGRIVYSVVNGSSPWAANFDVERDSGRVVVRKPLDFEAIPGPPGDSRNISFRVRASDHGSPPLWAEVPVTVVVLDANDNPPVFSKTLYAKSVPEDVRDGSMVVQVAATDADQSPANSRVYYRLLSGGADKFVIDTNTGIISVAKGATLDPDKSLSIGASKMSRRMWYLLKVMAIDSSFGASEQLSSIATVNVSIVDVNNKPPEFANEGLPEVFVPEDAPLNAYVTRITATDPDEKPILRYSLDYSRSEARNEFGMAVDLPAFAECFSIGPVDGVVRVAKPLDRESWSELKLSVVVEDIAAVTKGQKARATFTVHVTDINDNQPQFSQRLYRAVVPENSIPGTSIIVVTAEDRDTNKSLTYSLQSRANPDFLKLLRINSTTGEVSVLGRIDREQYSWINVTVRAEDSGGSGSGSSISGGSSNGNSQNSRSPSSSPSSSSPLVGTAELAITVLDENDNNPVFEDEGLHKVTIPEDAQVGSLVVKVTATDADIGAFGKLTYLLDSSSSFGKFRIDRETGAIIVADKLDREAMATYKLLVQAWDNYEYGFSTGESRKAFKTLTIVVSDVNDETPVIVAPTGDAQCTSVTEFHGLHETVMAVKAVDGDDPKLPNGQVVFELVNGNEDGLFEIVPDGGVGTNSATIRARSSLRGRVGNYTLLAKVSDTPTKGPRSSTSPLHICVQDVNDHNPIFVKPPSNMTIRIAENATIGTKVVDVLALDSDSGANAIVRYRLRELPNGHWRSFAIDPASGVITLAKSLDRETLRVHELRVQAYDLGTPTSLSTDLDLAILVTNVDDYEPEFTQDVFQVVFTENLEPGVERYKLLPTIDKDDNYEVEIQNDPNAAFKSIPCYFIVGGDGLTAGPGGGGEELFRLDTFTHELTATRPLDRELKANYTLIVQATNECFKVPPRVDRFDAKDNSLLQVLVGVRDVNDNAPKFAKRIFSGGITTDTDYGTVFMSVKAVDADVGANAQVSYYLISDVRRSLSEGLDSIPARPFSVNKRNGEISLAFDPQKDMKGYFEFEVKANDTDGLADTAKVLIYLLRDDQRVRFVLRLTPQELREKLDKFSDVLANITGALVNIDSYRFHEGDDGTVDQKKTDLYLHFVNRQDNSIMEVNSVLLLIDKNIEFLDDLYKEFNVLVSEPTTAAEPFMEWEDQLKAGLAGTSAFLLLLLILVVSLCMNQKNRFERQLKAATVPIFGHEPQLTRSNVPNTNQHATEGSNPMWMTGYDNQWYKDEEQLSHSTSSSGSSNSLDENALTTAAIIGAGVEGVGVNGEVGIEDHLHFSSLDTLDNGGAGGVHGHPHHHHHHHHSHSHHSHHAHHEHIAVRSESSGNSSSSTTNDRSALCARGGALLGPGGAVQTITGGVSAGAAPNTAGRPLANQQTSTFANGGTQGRSRPTTQPPPLPANPPPPAKKPMAPKPPPQPPNIVVISNAGQCTTKVEQATIPPSNHGSHTSHHHHISTLQRANGVANGRGAANGTAHFHAHASANSTTTPKSPCINNIYIETFSNHHKSNPASGAVVNTKSNQTANGGGANGHAHYHHYHHHGPGGGGGGGGPPVVNGVGGVGGPQYFGGTGTLTAAGHHFHHAHEASQLMNLETTEL